MRKLCPECGSKGGRMQNSHDFEPCDVCQGKGGWEIPQSEEKSPND